MNIKLKPHKPHKPHLHNTEGEQKNSTSSPIDAAMLFFSFFKTLVDQEVTVELKNDIEIKGTLKLVDQFLNLKLDNVSCANQIKYPHLGSVKTLFIRGSTVRYVHMNPNSVDCTLLQDASRREAMVQAGK